MTEVTNNLKTIFQTKNDLFVLTGSGTGGMEAAAVNMLLPAIKSFQSPSVSSATGLPASLTAFGANVVKL